MNAMRWRVFRACRPTVTHLWLAAVTMCAMMPASVWAQAATPAPQPTLKKFPAPWIGMAFMFVMVAIVVVVSLMPSKRSHQD